MSFQSQVYVTPGFGVVGEIFDDSPVRSEPFILNSSSATNNVFGRAFTIADNTTNPATVAAGGTGVFAGFLINPKSSTTSGTAAGGSLAPTLTLPNYSSGQLLNMGCIIVDLGSSAASIGDWVIFNQTDGTLDRVAPGVSIPSGYTFANAVVDRFNAAFDGTNNIAVIRVTNVQQP